MPTMTEPKRPRGRPKNPDSDQSSDRHTSPRAAFYMSQELADALDKYIASFRHKPDKSEVLRDALTDFLTRAGFVGEQPPDQPPPPAPEPAGEAPAKKPRKSKE